MDLRVFKLRRRPADPEPDPEPDLVLVCLVSELSFCKTFGTLVSTDETSYDSTGLRNYHSSQ